MKHQVLHTIYEVFQQWTDQQKELNPACRKGCSACCTQNVTITALEGEDILRYILKEDKAAWVRGRLLHNRTHYKPQLTTNDFARACLESRDVEPETENSASICPFLEEEICTIYPVRPFNCRLFISSEVCSRNQPALVPDFYMEASTAVTQLIEHLGQKEYWGNMLDVLPALLDIGEFRTIADNFNQTITIQARMQTLSARPLPGFLLSDEQRPRVEPLLETIFGAEVAGRRIEDILNGR